MPVYTCTTARGRLSADVKSGFAAEVTRIHSTVNRPAHPLIVNGWVRSGHPEDDTSRLVAEIAGAATRITGFPAERVLVVIGNSPARFAIEGGRVLPEPGQEQAWFAEGAWPCTRSRCQGTEVRRSWSTSR